VPKIFRHTGKCEHDSSADVLLAAMLLVIPQLVRPEFLVEVEIVAAKA